MRGPETRLLIKDHSYRWIAVTHFTVRPDGPTGHPERLAALIGHPAYWYGYISERVIQPGIHGPYRLDEITADVFETVDAAEAHEALNKWLYQYGPIPADLIDGDLSSVRRAIDDATMRFRLPDLGERAHHDVGWILHSGFCELVLLGPAHEIVLLVASGD